MIVFSKKIYWPLLAGMDGDIHHLFVGGSVFVLSHAILRRVK